MDSFRISEKNSINNKIRETNSYLQKNENTIKRFKSQNNISAFETEQINKLTTKNKEYKDLLLELNDKLTQVSEGKFDNNFKEKLDIQANLVSKSIEKNKEKYLLKKEKEINNKILVKQSYNVNGNNSEKYMDKELNRFYKICNSLPPYIQRNLKEMPNNKGYIFKNVYFYGELPSENNKPTIMFEKKYNDRLLIHETDSNYHTVYEKLGKNRRTLISQTPRSNISKELKNNFFM